MLSQAVTWSRPDGVRGERWYVGLRIEPTRGHVLLSKQLRRLICPSTDHVRIGWHQGVLVILGCGHRDAGARRVAANGYVAGASTLGRELMAHGYEQGKRYEAQVRGKVAVVRP